MDRKSKYHSQGNRLVRPQQSFHLNTNTRIAHLRNNSRTYINRMNFLWLLNLVLFNLCFFYLSFFPSFSYFIPVILNPLSLFSYPYVHIATLPPSPALQSIYLVQITLSAPSHPLFPHLPLPLPFSPNLSAHHPSLLDSHHLLTRLLYQICITPAP
jgi:hypothetical protein